MKVSKVEWIEEELVRGREKFPYTFFELDEYEQEEYDSFRGKHDFLRAMPKGKITPEKEKAEKEMSDNFLHLISPYFETRGLEATGSFTTYDKSRKTYVFQPRYLLFENKKPFDSSLEFFHTFSTEDEDLSCKSHFVYHSNSAPKSLERSVVYDFIGKIIEGKKQDGMTFPIISRRGDFINFASTDFTAPLYFFIKNILMRTSPETMKELRTLYQTYLNESNKDYSGAKIKAKVFREAYERKLEEEIGFYDLLAEVSRTKI